MPYQNTASTGGVSKEYYSWNYFNSSIQKLSGIKPSGVNISYKAPTGINYQDNWANDVANWMTKGAEAYSEWQTQHSTIEAKKYVATHSLDDYKKDVEVNNVPFQNDPIAMGELKRGYGEIAFSLAEQDFSDIVKTGEFARQGYTDEQMDAEYFNYVKKRQDEVAQSLGFNPNDEDFVAGYYNKSPAARIRIGNLNRSVTNDWRVKEARIQRDADIQAKLSVEGLSVENTAKILRDSFVNNMGSVHIAPDENQKDFISAVTALAKGGKYTLQDWQELGKKEFTDGKSFRDYIGQDVWDSLGRISQDTNTSNNAQAWDRFTRPFEDNVANGEPAPIRRALDKYLADNRGKIGTEDMTYKYLANAEARAKQQRKLLLKQQEAASKKANEDAIKASLSDKYVESIYSSPIGIPMRAPDEFGLTQKDIDMAFARKVYTFNGNQDARLEFIITSAKKTDAPYNPAKNFIKMAYGGYCDSLGGLMDSYNTQTLDGLNPDKGTVPQPPPYIEELKKFMQKDPDSVYAILNKTVSDDQLSMISALATYESFGITWDEAFKGMSRVRALNKTPQGRQKKYDINASISAYIIGDDEFKRMDGGAYSMILNTAYGINAIKPTESFEVPAKTAIQRFKDTTSPLLGTRVPNMFFSGSGINFQDGLRETEVYLSKEYPEEDYSVSYDYVRGALNIHRKSADGINNKIVTTIPRSKNLERIKQEILHRIDKESKNWKPLKSAKAISGAVEETALNVLEQHGISREDLGLPEEESEDDNL